MDDPIRPARKVKVGLVQINNSFSDQNYLPLSIGVLQAYAQRHLNPPEDFEFLMPVYSRIPVQSAVEKLLQSDIVLFSAYVWNIRISLAVARSLKELRPEIVVVFGGPHVPERPAENEQFMRANPFIDIACTGGGEQAVVQILEQIRKGAQDWSAVPGASFLSGKGELVRTPRAARIDDLNSVPSPYLEGVFVPLMEAHPAEHWIGLWETNRGCPFSCTFCDWGSATQSKVFKFELERLYREIEWFAAHKIEYIFCCDANFGMLPRDLEIAGYVAETKRKLGYPHALSVQNTKNATERAYQVQKILSDAGLNKGVDVALQSMDPQTLESIRRGNISTETYQELQRRFTRDKVDTYTDLILGLPGETYDSFAEGVSSIIENGQHNRIQFNNLSILPNAEMGDPEYQKKYGMVTVEIGVVNIHGALVESPQEVTESQLLVIGTNTMPQRDWARTRSLGWMAALLHFDKILQMVFVLLHELCGVRYRDLIELFLAGPLEGYPACSSIQEFFMAKAGNIQGGGFEYCESKEWLGIWWPADEYILIKLCVENKLGTFYQEAESLLDCFLKRRSLSLPPGLLHAAVEFNRELIKQPFHASDLTLELPYNIWEFYQSALRGEPVPLENKATRHQIQRTAESWSSWDDWCRQVIWYGNKRGAYIYGNQTVGAQLAGHF